MTNNKYLVTLLDVRLDIRIGTILANSSFTLPVSVLPLRKRLLEPRIHCPNRLAVIVRQQEPALVILQQLAKHIMFKRIMVNRKITIRVHPLEHLRILPEIVRRIQEEEIIWVIQNRRLEITTTHFQSLQLKTAQLLNPPIKLLLLDFIRTRPP